MRSHLAGACFMLLTALSAHATRYVSTTGGNQAPYDTWARAARDIQTAINAAGANETILVGNGTYNITTSIQLSNGKTLRSANGRAVTTIRAAHTSRCVSMSLQAVLDGFSLRNGRASGQDGGGVLVDGSGTVRNCDIRECSAGLSGGGVALSYGGLVEDCLIYKNHSDDPGGGVHIDRAGTVRNCAINSNDVSGTALCWGGGVGMREGGLVEYCQINDNRVYEDGGGVHIIDGGTVRNCQIRNNTALLNGGGVYILNTGSVERCLIMGNTAEGSWPQGQGGGVVLEGADAVLLNCRVVWNVANDRGGGIMIKGDGKVRSADVSDNDAGFYGGGLVLDGGGFVAHSTVVWNEAVAQRGGGIHCIGGGEIYNSVIYYNGAGAGQANIFDESGGGFYINCCTPTTPAVQIDTINSSPGFVSEFDYRPIPPASPLVDAGAALYYLGWGTDLRGTSRRIGGRADIGAYEAYGAENNMVASSEASDFVAYRNGAWHWRKDAISGVMNSSWGYAGAVPVAGEFNRTRVHDCAVYDLNSGNWYIRDDLGGYTWGFRWGWKGATPVSGDYNGDGATDLAVLNVNDATWSWYIYSIYSHAVIQWGFPFGTSGMLPVSGDFDGDGFDDPAAFHPASGAWYIYSLANSRPIVWGRAWGYAGCVPVSGDFDGDGCDDLAVYDATKCRWFIRTASDFPLTGQNPILLWDFAWGFAGAKPLAGDYDYDGKSDICVYSPSTSQFYAWKLAGHTLAWGLACPTTGVGAGMIAVKR